MIKAQIIGNIGRDAEAKTLDSGATVISFSVAHTEKYKNKAGEWVDKTIWVDCALWKTSGQSDNISKYLLKGKTVYCEGEPGTRAWKSKDSDTVNSTLTLNVRQIQLLTKSESSGTNSAPSSSANNATEEEDELPF